MKQIGYNNWLINQQKENRLKRYKKITLFRRYWDSGNKEYTWESKVIVRIDQDIIKCGQVTWKADTDQLNIWKMGNISLVVDNTHGKWDVDNALGYFNGFVAFLSMIRVEVGFIATDGTIYEIFIYQGLITDNGIVLDNEKHLAVIKVMSLDYMLQTVNAEEVSQKPVYPKLRYYNSDIFTVTTIGKSGAGWSTNNYQNKIVIIFGGLGKGQTRSILSNTSDTITVTDWEITPDSTSDFEIVGEWMSPVGDTTRVEWTTIQPGVGKIINVWIDNDIKEQGNHYTVSQLNEVSLGAKITFNTPPDTGEKIVVDYIYWYQNQTFKYIIEKILSLAKIDNKSVEDIVFPTDVEIEWEQTSQADWQAGTINRANLDRYPGDILIDDRLDFWYKAYYMGHEPESSSGDIDHIFYSSGNENDPSYSHAQKFLCTKSAYVSYLLLNFYSFDSVSKDLEGEIRNWQNDTDPEAGSIVASITNNPAVAPGRGSVTFMFDNIRLIAGNKYWFTYRRKNMISPYSVFSTNKTMLDGSKRPNKAFERRASDGSWSSFNGDYIGYLIYYYHPYYNNCVYISQTKDCGTNLVHYGKISVNVTNYLGYISVSTQTRDTDSGWSDNWYDWDPRSQFKEVTSPVRRYIRIRIDLTSQYRGGSEPNSNDINTPFVHSLILKYYTSEYQPLLVNLIGQSGKSAIESIARLANYEMGFSTEFDDNTNMDWDDTYDGNQLPQDDISWKRNKSGSPGITETIISGELFIEGDFGRIYYWTSTFAINVSAGWTVEIKLEKLIGTDEEFGIIVHDGTFYTKVIVTNLGYLKLKEYDKNDISKSKKAEFPSGERRILKVARKGSMVKIYVDDKLVLCSIANNPAHIIMGQGGIDVHFIAFGQLESAYEPLTPFKSVIDWYRINFSVPCFETYYLPKYYFKNRSGIVDSELELKVDQNYIRLYNFQLGWNKVYNNIQVTHGDYSYYANAITEFDESPNSEDLYGKKVLSLQGAVFLKSEDTNTAIGAAKIYYVYYKVPRKRFKLFCNFLFQLNLSDKVHVFSNFPLILNNLPCKIVGIVLDIDNFTLDLDCEEII